MSIQFLPAAFIGSEQVSRFTLALGARPTNSITQFRVVQRALRNESETVLSADEFGAMLEWLELPARVLPTAELVAKSPHQIRRD
jgi:hypothetical protein